MDPSVAADGTLLYVDVPSPGPQQLAILDRAGARVRLIGQPQDLIRSPGLSPEGKHVVVQGFEQGNFDIWVHEIEAPAKTRISFDPTMDSYPVWMGDSARVSWRFDRQGNADIFWRPLNRDAQPEPLISTPASEIPADWCAGGDCVVYIVSGLDSGIDIWYGVRERGGPGFETKPFVASPFNEVNPRLSPDGRYLAYCSDESGAYEVFVRAFPGGDSATQVSRNGGCQPRWSRESSELFYVERDTLISAAVVTDPEFHSGPLERLFRNPNLISTTPHRSTYDVTQDGTSVILAERLEESGRESYRPQIHVVQNWSANLSPLAR
jgi:Tol biopolymer transport system component